MFCIRARLWSGRKKSHRMRALAPEVLLSCPVQTLSAACLVEAVKNGKGLQARTSIPKIPRPSHRRPWVRFSLHVSAEIKGNPYLRAQRPKKLARRWPGCIGPARQTSARRSWGHRWMMIPRAPPSRGASRGSAVGAALSCFRYGPHFEGTAERFELYRSAASTDFPIIGRGTYLSNKINATESTNQLIWTAPTQVNGSCSSAMPQISAGIWTTKASIFW
jgi:hypothetical protein